MNRIALAIVIASIVGAEIFRPTQWTSKKISSTSLFALGATMRLDGDQLADLPPIATPALGNIDVATIVTPGRSVPVAPAGATTMSAGDTLDLVGWCADPESRAPGSALLAIVDGRRIDATAAYRSPRPDVARIFHAPAMSATGFEVRLHGSDLGPGSHTIRIGVVADDRRGVFVFPTPENVNVTGS